MVIYKYGYPNWKACWQPAIPQDQTLAYKNKKKHLHLLRKENIYFKLQYWLFSHKKKENSDLTVVTSCAKNVQYKNGGTSYWSCLHDKRKKIQ